jgi:hypothetical protein
MFAAEDALPWSFTNGSAAGCSIHLESAYPTPGTEVTVRQSVKFQITVAYRLSIADKGSIVLVVQDETGPDDGPCRRGGSGDMAALRE